MYCYVSAISDLWIGLIALLIMLWSRALNKHHWSCGFYVQPQIHCLCCIALFCLASWEKADLHRIIWESHVKVCWWCWSVQFSESSVIFLPFILVHFLHPIRASLGQKWLNAGKYWKQRTNSTYLKLPQTLFLFLFVVLACTTVMRTKGAIERHF